MRNLPLGLCSEGYAPFSEGTKYAQTTQPHVVVSTVHSAKFSYRDFTHREDPCSPPPSRQTGSRALPAFSHTTCSQPGQAKCGQPHSAEGRNRGLETRLGAQCRGSAGVGLKL